MNNVNLKNYTKLAVLNAIKNGYTTLDEIMKVVNISKISTCQITKDLIKKNIIKCETFPENKNGRRTNHYSVVDKYHSMFIEQRDKYINCISINISGTVIERLDYVLNPKLSLKDNIQEVFHKFKRKRIFGKYCIGIFAVCDNDDFIKNLPEHTFITTKEKLILNCLSDPNKMILFNLGKKQVISAYSHIHYPQKGIGEKTICKTLNIDIKYDFTEELYDGVFLSLAKFSLDGLSKLL